MVLPKPVIPVDSTGAPITTSNPLGVGSADGAQATVGTTTDASSASTLVGLLKNIKAALAGTLGISQKAQTSTTSTLQNAATANGNGTVVSADGWNGSLELFINNGAGSCTLTVQGSLDATFAIVQDTAVLGVVKLWDSANGTNTVRTIVSGVLAIAANTSYLFAVVDAVPNVRAPISAASGLGAGTSDTGCTVKLYEVPV